MDVVIGSNCFRNTDGMVHVEGVPQIEFTLRKPAGPLLVNFVVFDENGRLTAKVVDSSMMFNEAGTYQVSRTPTTFVMKKSRDDKVVLQAELAEPNKVIVQQAEFVTAKGHVLEVTAVEWRIGTNRAAQGDSDANGGPAAIG